MFLACGVRCVADISSVSPSSEQSAVCLLHRRVNARNVGYTPYPTGEKHTISTFVDQTCIQRTRLRGKNSLIQN